MARGPATPDLPPAGAPPAGLPEEDGEPEGGLVDALAEDPRWDALGLGPMAERAAQATLRRLRMDPARYEISLLGCSDARIAELNADFRGKPQPTNVLSWPSSERGAARPGGRPRLPVPEAGALVELGDIAIAWETCDREARAAGLEPARHATHLLVHATLHLLGFDHETDADAALMEGIEREVLAGLGIADPYAAGAQAASDQEPQTP